MQTLLFTDEGWMDLEEQYVPAVVAADFAIHKWAALEARAIVARTYVLRAMRDDPKLGTEEKPIPNSDRFQVFAAKATGEAREAAQSTKRLVCRYKGQLILCNSVAGALWSGKGSPGEDATDTERWVTYNEGKAGAAVKPSGISLESRPDNRGCLSSNGAEWLASEAGYDFPQILRYFYGADLEVAPVNVPSPTPGPTPKPNPGPSPSPTPTPTPSPNPSPNPGPVPQPRPPFVQPASDTTITKPASNSEVPLPVIAAIAFALVREVGR